MTAGTSPSTEAHERARRDRFWRIVGITIAVIATVTGLAIVAFGIFFAIAINSWGSNK